MFSTTKTIALFSLNKACNWKSSIVLGLQYCSYRNNQVTFKILYQILTNPLVEKTSLAFVLILFSFLGILNNYYWYKLKKHMTFFIWVPFLINRFVVFKIYTPLFKRTKSYRNQDFIDSFQCDLHMIITSVNKRIKSKSRIAFYIYLIRI